MVEQRMLKPLFQEMSGLKVEYGISLAVIRDDLFPYYYGGNKARKFLYIIKEIEKNGYDAVVTTGSTQSNHCRVVAIGCAARGVPCVLVLHGEGNFHHPQGNELLMRLSGAQIIYTTPDRISLTIMDTLKALKKNGYKPYALPGGGHCLAGAFAYWEAMLQLAPICQKRRWIPDYIFLASGTGGTQTGILAGVKKLQWDTRVVGVSVARQHQKGIVAVAELYRELAARVNIQYCGGEIIFRDDWVGRGYGKYNQKILRTIASVARKEGVYLDPTYTGKAFYGMLAMIKNGEVAPGSKVLFWHTGGVFNLLAAKTAIESYL